MAYKFSACGDWFGGEPHERIYAAKKYGFKAIEMLLWKKFDIEKVKTALDETGLELSAILFGSRDESKSQLISNSHGIVYEDAADAFADSVSETLEACKALGCRNIVVTTGNERSDVSREVQKANVIRALKKGAEVVRGSGVKLVLEPLNVLVNHMGYFLVTTAESIEILNAVDSDDVQLLYDVYHQQISEGNLINNIRANISQIGHIHIGDVPGRKEPGTGEINYPNVFKAIEDVGYSGYITYECGLSCDVDEVCSKARK